MDIKENIKGEVLSYVANEMNVTEDLLIQMISSDVYNGAVVVFSWTIGSLLLSLFSGFIMYFQMRKTDGEDDHMLFAGISMGACILSLIIVLFIGLATNMFNGQIEALFNHEYAVVKEITSIYDEMKNPTVEEANQ